MPATCEASTNYFVAAMAPPTEVGEVFVGGGMPATCGLSVSPSVSAYTCTPIGSIGILSPRTQNNSSRSGFFSAFWSGLC